MAETDVFQLSEDNASQGFGDTYRYHFDNAFLGNSRPTPSTDYLVAENNNFVRFTMLMQNPDTQAVSKLQLNSDGTPVYQPVGVAAAAAVTGAGESTSCPVWEGGKFNHERLIWPAALDTYAKRRTFVRKYFNGAIFDVGEVKGGSLAY